MTMQEGLAALGLGTAARQMHNRAYFLDLLGDSHTGLGRHEAAIEAYRQAAQEFEAQGAPCSYALCLLKIADSYLSLDEPWHAVGHLEACLPLLHDLGLRRHQVHAQDQLARCRAGLVTRRAIALPPVPRTALAAEGLLPVIPGRAAPGATVLIVLVLILNGSTVPVAVVAAGSVSVVRCALLPVGLPVIGFIRPLGT